MTSRFLTTIFISVISYSTYAQTSGQAGQTMKIVLNDVIDIRFMATGNNAGMPLSMKFTSPADFYKGVESTPQKLRIRANKGFTVSVRANSTATNRITNAKLPSFVYLKVPENNTGGNFSNYFSSNNYRNLSQTDFTLLKDCVNGGNQTFTIQYKAVPGFMVDPGIYTVDVVFTATRF